jgi:hypothetical protein
LWFCHLVGALIFDALSRGFDRIRSVFFDFWQTGLQAIHQLFESFAQVL